MTHSIPVKLSEITTKKELFDTALDQTDLMLVSDLAATNVTNAATIQYLRDLFQRKYFTEVVSTPYNAVMSDFLLVETGAGDRTVNLPLTGVPPTITLENGSHISIRKITSDINKVIINAGTNTINGSSTFTLYNQNETVDLFLHNNNWVVSNHELGLNYKYRGAVYYSNSLPNPPGGILTTIGAGFTEILYGIGLKTTVLPNLYTNPLVPPYGIQPNGLLFTGKEQHDARLHLDLSFSKDDAGSDTYEFGFFRNNNLITDFALEHGKIIHRITGNDLPHTVGFEIEVSEVVEDDYFDYRVNRISGTGDITALMTHFNIERVDK